ncbi:MFS general substrate transporter [Gymnopus androsaceus JB14]|uniref:MFS general substrate transporter n=1 Tax=Gymnopus androsaceus JB14 TaxID=1447944 RepID=A0A6A4HZG4_9AGAR|nr:MFS general substrate transporter [Gymnopus androsaceus JB14]
MERPNSPEPESEPASSLSEVSIQESPETAVDIEGNTPNPISSHSERRFSVFSRSEKLSIIVLAAIAGIVSPFTGSIYFPALNTIASDLRIFQGLAPSVIGTVSDVHGRRPAYLLAFAIYVVANLALALQDSYAALLVLRCLQSAGSSATIALGSAVVADLVTRAERGSYIGYTSLSVSLGPALGPVVGGVLNQYLGWQSIFWFLLIFGGVLLIAIALFLPETGRRVVGDGSVQPPKWDLSLVQWLRIKRSQPFNGGVEEDKSTLSVPLHRPNPLRILLEPGSAITLGFGSLLFAGYFMVATTLSEQLEARFGFSSAIVGLCYLPLGFGSLISRWTAGQLFDWNFRRHARLLGITLDVTKQQQIKLFPIERIRLEVSIPMIYISCGTVLGYTWAMETNASLAGIEVALFFLGLFFSSAVQGLNTLVVDTHQDTPASATAANNMFRCFMSAGGTAIASYMIDRMGIGYMGVFISGVWICFSPFLWLVLLRGRKWREKQQAKREYYDTYDWIYAIQKALVQLARSPSSLNMQLTFWIAMKCQEPAKISKRRAVYSSSVRKVRGIIKRTWQNRPASENPFMLEKIERAQIREKR